MPTKSSVGGFQKKHRFSGFLRERHRAAVVLERSKAMGIIPDINSDPRGLVKHRLSVGGRNAGHPAIIGLESQPQSVVQQIPKAKLTTWLDSARHYKPATIDRAITKWVRVHTLPARSNAVAQQSTKR